jgi:pSer/pThr/pTyr-binding forkhead associated (FHA) protein
VRAGPDVGREFPITGHTTFVGANPSQVDLVLDDEFVSGRHARIQRKNDTLYVEDLGSTNQTFVNNRMLKPGEPLPLGENDLLTLGGTTLQWYRRSPAAPQATPAVATRGNQKQTEQISPPRQEQQP